MNIKQFSKEHLSAVLGALIRVKNGEIDEIAWGICWNTKVLSGEDAYDVIEKCAKLWPKYSGDKFYPVPSPCTTMSASLAYNTSRNQWEDEYGALRYELLDFLIDELTKVVDSCDE